MKFLLYSESKGALKAVTPQRTALLASTLLVALVAVFAFGRWTVKPQIEYVTSKLEAGALEHVDQLTAQLRDEKAAVADLRFVAERRLSDLAVRVGDMQARMMRVEALGSHLTNLAELDQGEFDFAMAPALGGAAPDEHEVQEFRELHGESTFDALDSALALLQNREAELELLSALLTNQDVLASGRIQHKPLVSGWMSSSYGRRVDPFTGKRRMHKGIDFAGRRGAEITAVGAGIVTWSGSRYAYGNTVEISHPNGYVTRYAHNQSNVVTTGETVVPGQLIAYMGSSGRSTGPHVHFEVLQDGKQIDPQRFLSALQ